jgi:hypothetical protein
MEHFKEIGGNFPLNYSELDIRTEILIQHESPYFFSSGRSAIMAMIQLAKAQGKKVALPYFTCHSVIEPFDKMGCEIIYYPIEINLKVDVSTMIEFCNLEQPYLLLYHDYFGMDEGGGGGGSLVQEAAARSRDFEFATRIISSNIRITTSATRICLMCTSTCTI